MKKQLLLFLSAFITLCINVNTWAYDGTPYQGIPHNIPGTIIAGEYDEGGEGVAYHDVDTLQIAASNGGTYRVDEGVDANDDGSIGRFKDGEWLNYTVNVEAGVYDLIVMTATKLEGTQLEIYLDDSLLTTINIPNIGSYTAYEPLNVEGVVIPEGGDGKVLRFQNVNNDYTFLSVEFTKRTCSPYQGTPHSIPGLIIAGEYDEGGEGVAYHDNEAENLAASSGGTYRIDEGVDANNDGSIGRFKDGEWMNYTVDVDPGVYNLQIMTATKLDGTHLEIYLDDILLTTVDIPNIGSYTAFEAIDIEGIVITQAGAGKILRFQNVNNDYTFLSVEFIKTEYTGTPYGGEARTIPGLIIAGEYDEGGEGVAYHDVDADQIAANNGGTYRIDEGVDANDDGSIGRYKDGEWMNYTVDVEAGNYDIEIMTATKKDGTQLEIFLDDSLLTVIDVPNNASYLDFVSTVVEGIKIPEGGSGKVLRFQNANNDFTFMSVEFTKVSYTGTPYGGEARTIPGLIIAGEYDEGGEGVAYHDTDETQKAEGKGSTFRLNEWVDAYNEGYIGWYKDGEWMNYTVDVEAGTYDVEVMTATKLDETQLEIYLDNVLITTIDIPNNASYLDFVSTVVKDVEITEGGTNKVLRFQNVNNDFTFLSVEFKEATTVNELNMSSITTYPVPFQNQLTITNVPQYSKISLYSVAGSKVLESYNGENSVIELYTSNIRSGVYLIKIENNNSYYSLKVIRK